MSDKQTVIECLKIIKAKTGHRSVCTTYDKSLADDVKQDLVDEICAHFDINPHTLD